MVLTEELRFEPIQDKKPARASMPPPARPSSRPSPAHRPAHSVSCSDSPHDLRRMSLSFTTPSSKANRGRPTSLIVTTPDIYAVPKAPEARPNLFVSELDSNSVLTALAAQERHVLELKEELQKAEEDLKKLKTQWAEHETKRKRSESRRVEPLRALTSPNKLTFDTVDGRRISIEDERRRAMYIKAKLPERKVLEGKHHRKLSLLSPAAPPCRRSLDSAQPNDPNKHVAQVTRQTREDLAKTGKQFIGDLREGIWSFFDDIKQATVGDEALKEPAQRNAGNTNAGPSSLSSPMTSSRASSRARQNPPPMPPRRRPESSRTASSASRVQMMLPEPLPAQDPSIQATQVTPPATDDSGWDNWDSPVPKRTTSPNDFSPIAHSSSRTSVRYILSISYIFLLADSILLTILYSALTPNIHHNSTHLQGLHGSHPPQLLMSCRGRHSQSYRPATSHGRPLTSLVSGR